MNDDGTAPNGALAIFYGSSTAPIAQRPITGFEQSQSGTGTLTFLGDGDLVDASVRQRQRPGRR
jgi:hypothetical protein